jgi:hypothetical protein
MSQQRLSKLQKWILTRCYGTLGRSKDHELGFLYRHEIVRGYYSDASAKAEASTSRAIRGLMDKGLITGYTPRTLKYSDEEMAKILEGKKPDISTLLALQISRTTEDKHRRRELHNKAMAPYLDQYKPSDKILMPALKKETIKVITLTEVGKEESRRLMLTNDKRHNLAIRPRKRGYDDVHFLD